MEALITTGEWVIDPQEVTAINAGVFSDSNETTEYVFAVVLGSLKVLCRYETKEDANLGYRLILDAWQRVRAKRNK